MAIRFSKTDKKKPSVAPVDELFSAVNEKVEEAIGNTSVWSGNQEKWHKLRMRIKKAKAFPFEGSSNLRMPTAEIKLRKLKSSLINVIFGIRPVVQVIPSPGGNWQTAIKIEKFLDHIICDKMGMKMKTIIAADQMLERGFFIMKPFWDYKEMVRIEEFDANEDLTPEEAIAVLNPDTPIDALMKEFFKRLEIDENERVLQDNQKEVLKAIETLRGGEPKVKLKLRDVLCDYPAVALASPENIYVPTDAGYNPQDCAFIVHEFFLPLRQLKENAQNGKGWDSKAVDEIEAFKDVEADKLTDTQKDKREGIARLNNPQEHVRIWEFYGWQDINGDGEQEKALITLAPDFSKVLRKVTLPFDSGKYPFVKFFYELTDDRWFAHRGIVEIMEDIIKEIDVQHMQKLDQQTIRNAPMFMYRAGMVNPNLVQFIPNQGIPVHGMSPLTDTLQVLNNNNPNVEYSYDKEEQILEGKVQELIGQIDFTLQSTINRREPRTLGEVQLQFQSQQQVFSLDADMFRNSMEELFNWIWDLWCQFGSDYYEFAYFGKEGYEPIRLSREEVQGKWTITVRGNDQNTNSQVRQQKAQTILQMVSNQVAIQSGVVAPQNIAEAYKRIYQELDVPNWEALVNQKPQPIQPPPQPPLIVPKFDDLEEGEQAQVLTSLGIEPDVEGMMLSRQMELAQLQSEHQSKIMKGQKNGKEESGNGKE